MGWFAEVADVQVARVIVAPSQDWCEQRLGGTWVEVFKYDPNRAYTGPGQRYDSDWPVPFASEWRQPSLVPPDDADDDWEPGYRVGAVVFHVGEFWVSTVDGNVWEPGVSAWRPHPTEPGKPPPWHQPTGAHDAYRIYTDEDGVEHAEMVTHDPDGEGERVWRTLVDANVWEPPIEWEQVDE